MARNLVQTERIALSMARNLVVGDQVKELASGMLVPEDMWLQKNISREIFSNIVCFFLLTSVNEYALIAIIIICSYFGSVKPKENVFLCFHLKVGSGAAAKRAESEKRENCSRSPFTLDLEFRF